MVSMGIDVRIDSEQDSRPASAFARYAGYDLKFLHRFDIERSYAGLYAVTDLMVGLADTGI